MQISNKLKQKRKEEREINERLRSEYKTQFKLIDINVIQHLLKYSDLRSTLNWCRANDLFVLEQGKSKTVNEIEFILAYYKPFIKKLKRKHSNWKEMFLNYLNGELGLLLGTSKEEIMVQSNYKAKTKSQISFLDKMKSI